LHGKQRLRGNYSCFCKRIPLFRLNLSLNPDEYMNRTGSFTENKELRIEIERAVRLNERFGPACLKHPESDRLLRKLRDLIGKTDSAMLQSGVVPACTMCASSGKGSCCFREMGESYGFRGLFVNLLLGSVLPEKTDFPGSCHFVGENGCKLQARQSFCLNYFCPGLKRSFGEEAILRIQQQAGEQLLAGWELERVLARYTTDANKLE
jgi:hypothetical protein